MQNPLEWLRNQFGHSSSGYIPVNPAQPEEELGRPDMTPQSYGASKRMGDPYAEGGRPGMDLGMLDVSMYNPRKDQTDEEPWVGAGGDMFPGSQAGINYMAVPRVGKNNSAPMYPYGSKVDVGGRLFTVRDLMGQYAGDDPKTRIPQWNTNRMDMFHPDETLDGLDFALQFGRKQLPGRYFPIGTDPNPLD